MKKQLTLVILGAALSFASYSAANATQIDCSLGTPDVSGLVIPNDGCEFSDSLTNDFLNPTLAVNDDAFFGHTDWVFDGRVNDISVGSADEGPDSVGIFIDGDTLSGAWSLTALASLTGFDVMLVFKDGSNAMPGQVVAYLLGGLDGSFSSPFFDEQIIKEISHISVYIRESVRDIPVPGALWLMGAGLAGLGFAARRKKRA